MSRPVVWRFAASVFAVVMAANLACAQRKAQASQSGTLSGSIVFSDVAAKGQYAKFDLRSQQVQIIAPANAQDLTVSPDGNTIAWIDSYKSLHVRPVNGGAEKVIGGNGGPKEMMPRFISNTSIAFVQVENFVYQYLMAANVQSGATRRVTKLPEDAKLGSSTVMAYVPGSGEQNPRFVVADGRVLRVISASGVSILVKADANLRYPAVSPDGQTVLFVQEGRGVMAIKIDGSNLRHMTDGSWPEWSPDGKHVAYLANSAVSRGLEVVNARNGRTLGRTPGAFLFTIVIANADGSNPVIVAGSDGKPFSTSGTPFFWR